MLSEAELSEMLDIRRKIDVLQMRYTELAAKMAVPPAAAGQFAVQPPPPPPVPVAHRPVYQQPVVQYAQPVTPYPQQPVQQPMMARPVAVQPLAPRAAQPLVTPAQPVQPPIPSLQTRQDDLDTKRLPACSPSAPQVPQDRTSMTLKDHVVDVLSKAGKPLPFEEVYKRIEEGGAPLPKDKPKLVVRQILYNKVLFQVAHGAFTLALASGAATPAPTPQRNPVFGNTKPGDLFKHRIDAMLGKDKK